MIINRPDRYPEFITAIGEDKADSIRYSLQGTGRRMVGGVNITNPLIDRLQAPSRLLDRTVDDVLYGLANTEVSTSGKPLRVGRLRNLLRTLPVLNTREIQLMLAVSPRQAQKYMKILKTAIKFIDRKPDK